MDDIQLKSGNWFALRGPGFIAKRATVLLGRYGISPAKVRKRIETSVANLIHQSCAPTFFVPGTLVKQYPQFFRRLQDAGAEIAVHSYYHINLKSLPTEIAIKQLTRASRIFELYGIKSQGFRCPYLSYTDALLNELPRGLFRYSSNQAIGWDAIRAEEYASARTAFKVINKLYYPKKAQDVVCIPRMLPNVVEVPVCVPDDLQLHDGLQLDSGGITKVWSQILSQTHRRGELFTLLFHSELASFCRQSLSAILRQARNLKPSVWVATLREISDWWWEKSTFQSEIYPSSTGLRISFICSSRATILARGLGNSDSAETWDGLYFRLKTKTLDVSTQPRPFIGIASGVPKHVVSFLKEQGYILDTAKTAPQCAIYLDDAILTRLKTPVELVNWIEVSDRPLVRLWRWPDGAKSALSLTGDLDALSLRDYFSRLFIGPRYL